MPVGKQELTPEQGIDIGLHAANRFRPGQWCSNNRKTECSLFVIGKTTQHKTPPSINYLLCMLGREIFQQNNKTGDESGSGALLLSGSSGILLSDFDVPSPRYRKMSYYHSQKSKLLKDFDATASLMRDYLVERYGQNLAEILSREVPRYKAKEWLR